MNQVGLPDVGPGMTLDNDLGPTPETDHATDAAVAPPAGVLTRRRAFGLAGAVGVAGLLAACGGGSDETTSGSASSSSAPPSPTEASPSESPSESESSPATGGGGGAALVKTSEVPVGGGKVLDDKKIVVTQPAKGDFKAFTAVCTHQACLVGSVQNNTISCPCHGSAYDASNGSVKGGPAPRGLDKVNVKVEGDEVVEA